nr:ECF-type sigma factor [Tahibacter caeni]
MTRLLEQARDGDATAWQRLSTLLQDDLLRLARCASTSDNPAGLDAPALAQECYRRIAGEIGNGAVANRSEFLALAGRVLREILVDHARGREAAGDGFAASAVGRETGDLLQLDTVLAELAEEDPRLVQIIDGRVFGGLGEVELAEALHLPLRTVQRLWDRARSRLRSLSGT